MANTADEISRDVAAELSPDVAYLQPSGETHFVGEAVLLVLGTTIVTHFAEGFLAAAKEEAEAWGGRAAKWLSKRIGKIFGAGDDSDDEDAEDAQAADEPKNADEAIEMVKRIVVTTETTTTTEVWAKSAEEALSVSLHQAGLPEEKAEALAASTRGKVMAAVANN